MTAVLRIALVLAVVLSLGVASDFGGASAACDEASAELSRALNRVDFGLALSRTVTADEDVVTSTGGDHVSPYWSDAISQWDRWIVYWARERELDPDLVAAVIRKESIGQPGAEGPYGSVGLMMVLPAEVSGMPWRPTAEELKQPGLNIRWGTGILKQIVRESGGDLLTALAAYNGGWDRLYLATTERYAHSVLTYYAYAIAARHGYSYQDSKVWTMVIMTRVDGHIRLIRTDTSGHFFAPCFDSALGFRDIYPEMVSAPRTRVTHFVDEDGHDVLIDAWLFVGGLDRHVGEMLAGTALPTLPRIGHRP
jgi:hypothetical protein